MLRYVYEYQLLMDMRINFSTPGYPAFQVQYLPGHVFLLWPHKYDLHLRRHLPDCLHDTGENVNPTFKADDSIKTATESILDELMWEGS